MSGAWAGDGALRKVMEAISELREKSEAQSEAVSSIQAAVKALLTHSKETNKAIGRLSVALEQGFNAQADAYADLESRVVALEKKSEKRGD